MDTIAFHNTRRIASGPLREAALAAREVLERDPGAHVLLFDADTARLLETKRREYIQEFAFGADGRSTERIVECILKEGRESQKEKTRLP